MPRILDRNEEQFVRESDKGVKEKWNWSWLTPSLRRPYTRNFFSTACRTALNTHSVFESFAGSCVCTRGCDKRWMTCIHAGVSRSPREHASAVPPDKKALPSVNEFTLLWIFA